MFLQNCLRVPGYPKMSNFGYPGIRRCPISGIRVSEDVQFRVSGSGNNRKRTALAKYKKGAVQTTEL